MIYDKISNINLYSSENEYLKKAFKSIEANDFLNFKNGKNDIDSDYVFAIKTTLILKKQENSMYEAHKDYIDIHVPIKNCEDASIAFVDNLNITSVYDKAGDCLLGNCEEGIDVSLSQGEFLVVFPEDAHRVGTSKSNDGQEYDKIIYKIMM